MSAMEKADLQIFSPKGCLVLEAEVNLDNLNVGYREKLTFEIETLVNIKLQFIVTNWVNGISLDH